MDWFLQYAPLYVTLLLMSVCHWLGGSIIKRKGFAVGTAQVSAACFVCLPVGVIAVIHLLMLPSARATGIDRQERARRKKVAFKVITVYAWMTIGIFFTLLAVMIGAVALNFRW